MMRWCLLFLMATVCHSAYVSTRNGVVSGSSLTFEGQQIYRFLGIPFAQPPVGKLRFRRPQPLITPWKKPLIADTAPKGCLQQPVEFVDWEPALKAHHGEDCLYLNVWTPSLSMSGKKSVMVWIHGGGFMWGEDLPTYDGRALAALGDVVVVGIHYRLGFLGFARFDDELVPGNNGLWDQQMALRWVHENIAVFGGDPQSVTVFGESAGSASVSYHLLNAKSARYFRRAIMMSGTALNPWALNPNNDAMETFYRQAALKYLGCTQTAAQDLLSCLQGKTEKQMSTAVKKLGVDFAAGPRLLPCVDGEFLKRSPHEMVSAGDIQRKDVMIGLTENEGGWMTMFGIKQASAKANQTFQMGKEMNETMSKQLMDASMFYYPFYPERPTEAVKELLRLKAISHEDPSNGHLNSERISNSMSLYMADCGVNIFTDALRKLHDTVYFYEFTHKPSQNLFFSSTPSWMKATHCDDLTFAFGLSLVYPNYDKLKMTEEEVHLSRRFIGDLASFAKSGKPLDPNWRPFTVERKERYRYGIYPRLKTGGKSRNECVFWDKTLPMVQRFGKSKSKETGRGIATDEL